jgi:LPXTG-motif cell wall-anchored protein
MASNQTSASSAATEPSSTAPTPQSINALVAQNRAPALPQGDQESAPSSAKQKANPTAIQQRRAQQETVVSENTSAQQPSSSVANQKPSSSVANDEGKNAKLPQTGSSLPLLLVIGALGIGGGTLYLLRR